MRRKPNSDNGLLRVPFLSEKGETDLQINSRGNPVSIKDIDPNGKHIAIVHYYKSPVDVSPNSEKWFRIISPTNSDAERFIGAKDKDSEGEVFWKHIFLSTAPFLVIYRDGSDNNFYELSFSSVYGNSKPICAPAKIGRLRRRSTVTYPLRGPEKTIWVSLSDFADSINEDPNNVWEFYFRWCGVKIRSRDKAGYYMPVLVRRGRGYRSFMFQAKSLKEVEILKDSDILKTFIPYKVAFRIKNAHYLGFNPRSEDPFEKENGNDSD